MTAIATSTFVAKIGSGFLLMLSLVGCDKINTAVSGISLDASTTASTASSPTLANAKEANTFVIGVNDTFPPMGFRDANGELIGYDIDLAREVAQRAGFNVMFEPINWNKKEDELIEKKNVDMIWSTFHITDKRKRIYLLSDPYIDNAIIIVVPINSPIQSKQDFNGKRIDYQSGEPAEDLIRWEADTRGQTVELQPKAEIVIALSDLLQHKTDVAVGDKLQLQYYIANSPGKFRVLKDNYGTSQIAVAFRKEDTVLVNKVNTALREIKKSGTEQKIHDKWFTGQQTTQQPIDTSQITTASQVTP